MGKGKLGVPQQTVADKGKRSYIYDRESTNIQKNVLGSNTNTRVIC